MIRLFKCQPNTNGLHQINGCVHGCICMLVMECSSVKVWQAGPTVEPGVGLGSGPTVEPGVGLGSGNTNSCIKLQSYVSDTQHTTAPFFYVCLFYVKLCCMCLIAMLYLGQVAVVNENLFSTSLPG